jgi:hypothetical protein
MLIAYTQRSPETHACIHPHGYTQHITRRGEVGKSA